MRISVDSSPGTRLNLKREVEHQIPLIEEDKQYAYYMPRCPDYLKEQLRDKIDKYVAAGWWYPAPATQAAPMLCIPKKDKTLRTVIDLRQQNANTHKDVAPLPDQDNIRQDVARARYRSKIDLSNEYEKVRVAEPDVKRTAFFTIYGTFYSRVMQQGDCNAVNSFQQLIIHIFRSQVGKYVHVYLDNILTLSRTMRSTLRSCLRSSMRTDSPLNVTRCNCMQNTLTVWDMTLTTTEYMSHQTK